MKKVNKSNRKPKNKLRKKSIAKRSFGAVVTMKAESFNEHAQKRETRLGALAKQADILREYILHHEDYDEVTFPQSFPVVKFCREVIGDKSLGDPVVKDFRRAYTALTSVVALPIPHDIILLDDETHQLSVIMIKQRQRLMMEEANEVAGGDLEADIAANKDKVDFNAVVEDVLAGNTTYDKDPDFMASDLAYAEKDVEVVPLDENGNLPTA